MQFLLILIPVSLALGLPCLIRVAQQWGLQDASRTAHQLGIDEGVQLAPETNRPWVFYRYIETDGPSMQTIRRNGKTVTKFVTPSGVVAVVAPHVSDELLTAMRRKLERKLRRSGHLKQKGSAVD